MNSYILSLHYIFFCAVLSLLCLNAFAQNTDGTQRTISLHYLQNEYYENMSDPLVISDSAIIYSRPDTSSDVVITLPFKKSLKIVREGFDENIRPIRKWYEVDVESGKGYIKAVEVATHFFCNVPRKLDYFVVTDFINAQDDGFAIYKYEENKEQFTDTFKSDRIRGDIVVEVNYAGWKNVDLIFHAKKIDAYCGGGIFESFVVDANGHFSELMATSEYGDDGSADSYSSSVWLPVKFANNNILLVQNGDVAHIFNEVSGKLNTHSFPKELTFPKMELIVFNERQIVTITDKNGEPLLNKDGSYKSKVAKDKTKFFRWNGAKLVPVK
ncbi:MAG: hypothetical protein ABI772_13100, partial [Bacteroidota bacterium]